MLISRLLTGVLLAVPAAGAALGLSFATAPTASAACSALPTNNGTATFTVTIPANGTYRFWAHLYSPSAGSDAVYLQVDDNYCQITVGNASIPASQFTWVDYQGGNTGNKINMNLSSGNHTVKLAGLDAGVGVDKVMFLADTACTPTGNGDNCVSTTTSAGGKTSATQPVVAPAAGTTTTINGTVSLPTSTTDGSTRKYYLNGKEVTSGNIDTTKLADGVYELKIVQTSPDGKTSTTTQKLVVDNVHTPLEIVQDWSKRPLNIVIALAILAALGGGGFALWQYRRRAHSIAAGLPASQSLPDHQVPVPGPLPTSEPIQPQQPGTQD